MTRFLRYLDAVLTNLSRVRTTGMTFSWLDAPTVSGGERSSAPAPATPARRRTETGGGGVLNTPIPGPTCERRAQRAAPSPPLHNP